MIQGHLGPFGRPLGQGCYRAMGFVLTKITRHFPQGIDRIGSAIDHPNRYRSRQSQPATAAPHDLGRPSRFPDGSPADDALRRAAAPNLPAELHVHPTQVYESLASLAVAAACVFLVAPRKRYDGQVMVFFLVAYSVLRFIIEVWRRDDRGGYAWLSTSQIVGAGLIAVAVLVHLRRRPRSGPLDADAKLA